MFLRRLGGLGNLLKNYGSKEGLINGGGVSVLNKVPQFRINHIKNMFDENLKY
jgi:NADP-dependent 3-hydroxy acid dehydrogenase YdfG